MPNYTSGRYMFEGGFQVWALDCEKSKLKREITRLANAMSALRKAERKELDYLVERFQDESLYKLRRGQRDHRISRKLRLIWEEQEEAEEDMVASGIDLEVVESEIDHYRHN